MVVRPRVASSVPISCAARAYAGLAPRELPQYTATERIAEAFVMHDHCIVPADTHGLVSCVTTLSSPVDGDLPVGIPFRTAAQSGPDATVMFAYIRDNSQAHRDEVNARITADERLSHLCSVDNLPFDLSKMVWGGFETIVSQ